MFGATLHTRGRILLNRATLHLPSVTTTTITRMSRKSRHCQSLAPQPQEVKAVLLRAIMERKEGKRLVFAVSTERFNATFSRLQTWWYTGRLAATCLARRARSDPLEKLMTPSLKDGEDSNLVLPEDLKANLECPVCARISLPPIMQCRNGHVTCNPCRY